MNRTKKKNIIKYIENNILYPFHIHVKLSDACNVLYTYIVVCVYDMMYKSRKIGISLPLNIITFSIPSFRINSMSM